MIHEMWETAWKTFQSGDMSKAYHDCHKILAWIRLTRKLGFMSA